MASLIIGPGVLCYATAFVSGEHHQPISIDYDPRTGRWAELEGERVAPPRPRCAGEEGFALGAGRCIRERHSSFNADELLIVEHGAERILGASELPGSRTGGQLVGASARGEELFLLILGRGLSLLQLGGHEAQRIEVRGEPAGCSNGTIAVPFDDGFLVLCDTLQGDADVRVFTVSSDGATRYMHPPDRISADGREAWMDERGHVHGGYTRTDVGTHLLRGVSVLAIFFALFAFAVGIRRNRIDPVWTIVGALCGIAVVASIILEIVRGMNTIPFG